MMFFTNHKHNHYSPSKYVLILYTAKDQERLKTRRIILKKIL